MGYFGVGGWISYASLYCTNTALEIRLGNGAGIDHQRIQLENPAAFHIAGLQVT